MKPYQNDWESRNQYIQVQKSSFMSVKPMKEPYHQREIRVSEKIESHRPRESEEKSFSNLFADFHENQEVKKVDHSQTQEEPRISFQGLITHAKQVRQSENISVDNESLKIGSITKSISQKELPNKVKIQEKHELVRMRSANHFQNEEDSEEVKALMKQIKIAEAENNRIREENIHLRLRKVKLSSDSESMKMLSMRMEIQQYKRKIDKLKAESAQQIRNSPSPIQNKFHSMENYYQNMHPQHQKQNNEDFQTPYTNRVPYNYQQYPHLANSRLRGSQIRTGERARAGKANFNQKASQIYHHQGNSPDRQVNEIIGRK